MRWNVNEYTDTMNLTLSTLVFAAMILAATCESDNFPVEKESGDLSATFLESLRESALPLYEIGRDAASDENFVMSPLSIQLALYMVWQGANNDTRTEIESLLRTPEPGDDVTNEISRLMHDLNGNSGEFTLNIHNGMFYDDNRMTPNESFEEALKSKFIAEVERLDFSTPTAVEEINGWVREKTEGKIPEVLDQISDREVLFLLNALYMKADWNNAFAQELTADRPFHLADGEEIRIPMMSKTEMIDIVRTEEYQAVRLLLADSALAAYFIMPDNSGTDRSGYPGPEVLEKLLDGRIEFSSAKAGLSLPVIETKTNLEMNPVLKALGMKSAFDPERADLSGIGSAVTGALYISRVLHDTYLKIDEGGVEGAAVTTVGIGTTSAPITEPFVFDHPFTYLIVDQRLGLPLFIGRFTGRDTANNR